MKEFLKKIFYYKLYKSGIFTNNTCKEVELLAIESQ